MTESVSAGCADRQREQSINNYTERRYHSRVAVHEPLITKMNAHFRVQWCKIHRQWSTEGRKWSDEMSHLFMMFQTSGQVHVWPTQDRPECLTPTEEDLMDLSCSSWHFTGWFGSTCPLKLCSHHRILALIFHSLTFFWEIADIKPLIRAYQEFTPAGYLTG